MHKRGTLRQTQSLQSAELVEKAEFDAAESAVRQYIARHPQSPQGYFSALASFTFDRSVRKRVKRNVSSSG